MNSPGQEFFQVVPFCRPSLNEAEKTEDIFFTEAEQFKATERQQTEVVSTHSETVSPQRVQLGIYYFSFGCLGGGTAQWLAH